MDGKGVPFSLSATHQCLNTTPCEMALLYNIFIYDVYKMYVLNNIDYFYI